MTLTGGSSGEIQTIPNRSRQLYITQPDYSYRFDFTYSATVTIDNLQFMLIPGPSNTLMQLLLDIVPFQTAYTDPNYPITETTIPDPRDPGPNPPNVTLPSYWPLFTDESVFPIDPNNFSSNDLLSAYLNLNEAAGQYALTGATFSDFLNLSANEATVYKMSDLSNLLEYAYTKTLAIRR